MIARNRRPGKNKMWRCSHAHLESWRYHYLVLIRYRSWEHVQYNKRSGRVRRFQSHGTDYWLLQISKSAYFSITLVLQPLPHQAHFLRIYPLGFFDRDKYLNQKKPGTYDEVVVVGGGSGAKPSPRFCRGHPSFSLENDVYTDLRRIFAHLQNLPPTHAIATSVTWRQKWITNEFERSGRSSENKRGLKILENIKISWRSQTMIFTYTAG